jgi:hypothetical protein
MILGTWKKGFEIELMAPSGSSRRDLAERVARHGGSVSPFFHPQSEPSAVPGQPIFENLTQGFEARDASGRRIAAFVDDLTLQAGLVRSALPKPGWYRIVADDRRLLGLVSRHCAADAPLSELLGPLAALFGTEPQHHPGEMVRVVDDRGSSIAIGAPLPGERERPCEIVTAPMEGDEEAVLTALLDDAIELGFSVPLEGATHIHFDATPLCSAPVLARLVDVLWEVGDELKTLVATTPRCVRLGRWNPALVELTRSEEFRAMDWPTARAALASVPLTKFCDFNLLNIAQENAAKHTFEVRILPVWLEPEPIMEAADLFEALLRWCCQEPPGDGRIGTLAQLLEILGPRIVAQRATP